MKTNWKGYIFYMIFGTLFNATGLWLLVNYLPVDRIGHLNLTWHDCFITTILINATVNVYNIKDFKKPKNDQANLNSGG